MMVVRVSFLTVKWLTEKIAAHAVSVLLIQFHYNYIANVPSYQLCTQVLESAFEPLYEATKRNTLKQM